MPERGSLSIVAPSTGDRLATDSVIAAGGYCRARDGDTNHFSGDSYIG
jgi:hypothetical protein